MTTGDSHNGGSIGETPIGNYTRKTHGFIFCGETGIGGFYGDTSIGNIFSGGTPIVKVSDYERD